MSESTPKYQQPCFVIAKLTSMNNKIANKQSAIKNSRWLFFNDYYFLCVIACEVRGIVFPNIEF